MIHRLLLFVLFSCTSIAWIHAAHIIGGTMTYECLGADPNQAGNNIYRFTMKVYRDCAGSGAPFDSESLAATPGTYTIFTQAVGGSSDLVKTGVLDAPVITLLDPGSNNPCVIVPPNVCVQEGVYTWEESLEVIQDSYVITYQRCCRNNTINNIIQPGATGATYTITITGLGQSSCNNSPTWDEFPPAVICVNQPLNVNHSATDLEGDQLVYEFCSPLQGGTQMNVAPNPDAPPPYDNVNFQIPTFTALDPIGGNPPVSIDLNTGLITGTPEVSGQFVVGICASEFRNGELLSVVQRDFQFNITSCVETVMVEVNSDFDLGDQFVYNSCVDSTLSFSYTGSETEISSYLWDFTGVDTSVFNPLSLNTKEVMVTFPGPGDYDGIIVLNPGQPCTDTGFISVTIAPPINPVFAFDYDTCVAGPVSFFNETDLSNLAIETFRWEFGDGMASEERTPIYDYEEPGSYLVEFALTDTLGCRETVSDTVTWFPVPPLIIFEPSAEVGCPPLPVTFTNLSSPVDASYQIDWDFGDGAIGQGFQPNHVYTEPGTYTITVDITSPIGCFTSDTFLNRIDVDSLPVADFTYLPVEGISNFNPTIQFSEETYKIREWEWYLGDGTRLLGPNPMHTYSDTGLFEVTLIGTHFYGCKDSITQLIDVVPQATYFLPNAFTPNEDSVNEFFQAAGVFLGITDFSIRIFNRYGQTVFASTDPGFSWNGRKDNAGRMSQNGVYTYVLRYLGPRGQMVERQGYVTLMR